MKLFNKNSKKVTKILMSIKLAMGTLAGSAYAMNNDKLGFWLLATVGMIDVVVSMFSSDEPTINH